MITVPTIGPIPAPRTFRSDVLLNAEYGRSVIGAKRPILIPNAVLLVVIEHPSPFLFGVICTVSSCCTNLALPSHSSHAYSSFGTITFTRIHILILVMLWVCWDRIHLAYVWFPFLLLLLCVHSFEISAPRYVYWSTIGSSSSQHFTEFTLFSLHTTTAHTFMFVVTLHFLVYASAFSICFCNPSIVSDNSHEIIHQSRHRQSPTATPSLLLRPLLYYHIFNIYLE